MAKIITTVVRNADETTDAFKKRCCIVLQASNAPGSFGIGRFAMKGGKLEVSCLWGLAYPELPADTCHIASYTMAECRLNFLTAT
jgi:hypothetical protein